MKRVAIVVSSVGFHWEELFQAYKVFRENSIEVDFYTPTGIEAKADPISLKYTGPLSFFGLGIARTIGPETAIGQSLLGELSKVRPLIELETHSYKAIYLPGGHGCLFDINKNEILHVKILEFFEQGKILSGVCHATSTFSFVESKARSITHSRKICSFSSALDHMLVAFRLVHKDFLPIPFNNEFKLIQSGAKVGVYSRVMAVINPWYFISDLPFITGVGPKATSRVAKEVVREI